MARKPESVFWSRIKPQLEALPNTWFERVQQVSIRGTPDVIGCVNGWFVALELKKDEFEEPDKLQQHKLDCITQAKGVSVVLHPENWDAIYEFLKEIACEHAAPNISKNNLN